MAGTTLATHTDDRGVATLTLNRPEKANAIDHTLLVLLFGALQDVAASSSVLAPPIRLAGAIRVMNVRWFACVARGVFVSRWVSTSYLYCLDVAFFSRGGAFRDRGIPQAFSLHPQFDPQSILWR